MVEATRVNTTLIRKKVKVLSPGLMVENMSENGRTVKWMESAAIFQLMVNQRKVSGQTAKELIGSTMYEETFYNFLN